MNLLLSKIKKSIGSTVLFLILYHFGIMMAQANDVSSETSRVWNLQNADIRAVIEQVSMETGKNFIIDPSVSGTISIVSGQPINADEVYEVFLSMLQISGYTAVEDGDVIRIIPNTNANYAPTAVVPSRLPIPNNANVVRVIPINHVNAPALIPVLRSLISPQGHLAAYAPSNVLIVADIASVVERLAEVVERVDLADVSEVESIPLEHASASEVVFILQDLMSTRGPGELPGTQVVLAADDRTNTVLISGDRGDRLRLRALVAEMDMEVTGSGNTEVVYLNYQKAEDMVPVLANIISSYYGANALGDAGATAQVTGGRPSQNNLAARPGALASSQIARPSVVNRGGGFGGGSLGFGGDLEGSFGRTGEYGPGEGLGEQLGPREAIGVVIGGFGVQSEPNTNALIISAPTSLMRDLKSVIARLDVRRAQVLVEAVIVELSDDVTNHLGVEWRGNGSVIGGTSGGSLSGLYGDFGLINNPNGFPFPVDGGLAVGFIHNGNIQALLSAFESNRNNDILATPTLIALDNTEARIFVGQAVPFETGQFNPNTTGEATPFVTTSQLEVGLRLSIVPQITQDQAILLAVEQIVDDIFDDTIPGQPLTNNRSISTNVLVNDGDVLVLGGLLESNTVNIVNKVPLLGDIPGLGFLFRSTESNIRKTNLMVFIRPTILRSQSDNVRVTNSKYNFMQDQRTIQDYYQAANRRRPINGLRLPDLDETTVEIPPPFF